MGPTWGPSGSCWPQMGPMLAPWTLLSRTPWLLITKGTGHQQPWYWHSIVVPEYSGFSTRRVKQSHDTVIIKSHESIYYITYHLWPHRPRAHLTKDSFIIISNSMEHSLWQYLVCCIPCSLHYHLCEPMIPFGWARQRVHCRVGPRFRQNIPVFYQYWSI